MKEYDFITAEYKGYKGSVYKDNMFGMEFSNFSLYDKTGKEIFHATLDNKKQYTEENVVELIIDALNTLPLLYEEIRQIKEPEHKKLMEDIKVAFDIVDTMSEEIDNKVGV